MRTCTHTPYTNTIGCFLRAPSVAPLHCNTKTKPYTLFLHPAKSKRKAKNKIKYNIAKNNMLCIMVMLTV